MADRQNSRKLARKESVSGIAADGESQIGVDGSLRTPPLTIRPSNLWSPEFAKFYASKVADRPWLNWPVPARNASRAAWDEFDAWLDEQHNAKPLATALERYPVHIEEAEIAAVRVAIISSKHSAQSGIDGRVLINLHGGGFVFNRGLSAGKLESIPLSHIGRMRVITLDYRQAPFHRYPAASEDVESVYLALLEQHEAESIGLYGFSAGAALAAQALARFQSAGLPRPGAVGMFGLAPPPPFSASLPWGPGWGDSGLWFSGTPKNEPTMAEKVWHARGEWYMEGAEVDDPRAYPGSFDDVLAKFPPTLFLSGTRELAMSTIVAAHSRLLRLGVDSSLYVMEGGPHGAHLAVQTPESHDAHSYAARWFGERLAK